jgi:hypothetical protein
VLVIYSHKKNLLGLDPGEKNCSVEGGRPKSFVSMRGRCVQRRRDLRGGKRSDLKAGQSRIPIEVTVLVVRGVVLVKEIFITKGATADLVKAGADEVAAEALAGKVWKAGVPGSNVEAKVGREVVAVEV